jgi:hypothetical protein
VCMCCMASFFMRDSVAYYARVFFPRMFLARLLIKPRPGVHLLYLALFFMSAGASISAVVFSPSMYF